MSRSVGFQYVELTKVVIIENELVDEREIEKAAAVLIAVLIVSRNLR